METQAAARAAVPHHFGPNRRGVNGKINYFGIVGWMTTESHQVSQPALRYDEKRSVVTKWDDQEMKKITQLAAAHGLKPGPFLTEYFRPHLANMEVRAQQHQEALPIDKAS